MYFKLRNPWGRMSRGYTEYMDEKERFHLEQAKPIVYSHGTYFGLGREIGTFGYSVRKEKTAKKSPKKKNSAQKKK